MITKDIMEGSYRSALLDAVVGEVVAEAVSAKAFEQVDEKEAREAFKGYPALRKDRSLAWAMDRIRDHAVREIAAGKDVERNAGKVLAMAALRLELMREI